MNDFDDFSTHFFWPENLSLKHTPQLHFLPFQALNSPSEKDIQKLSQITTIIHAYSARERSKNGQTDVNKSTLFLSSSLSLMYSLFSFKTSSLSIQRRYEMPATKRKVWYALFQPRLPQVEIKTYRLKKNIRIWIISSIFSNNFLCLPNSIKQKHSDVIYFELNLSDIWANSLLKERRQRFRVTLPSGIQQRILIFTNMQALLTQAALEICFSHHPPT